MPHYYNAEQGDLRPERITVRAAGKELQIWSGSGVFSRRTLDRGTKLLVETMELRPGWRVHDLGCGYGVVGIFAKLREPSCEVVCSDVNRNAVTLARRNAREIGLDIDVKQSDAYEKIAGEFDTILLNPPYVAGREAVFRLIEEGFARLRRGGVLQVVARHQKGGKAIKEFLEGIAGSCDDSRKGGGFRVYVATKE